jgi:hypothetical protein
VEEETSVCIVIGEARKKWEESTAAMVAVVLYSLGLYGDDHVSMLNSMYHTAV